MSTITVNKILNCNSVNRQANSSNSSDRADNFDFLKKAIEDMCVSGKRLSLSLFLLIFFTLIIVVC